MAEWVRVAAAKSDNLSSAPELVWQKEKADGCTCTLFSDRDADTSRLVNFFKEFDLEEWMCTLTVWALQLVNAKDEKEGESLGKALKG